MWRPEDWKTFNQLTEERPFMSEPFDGRLPTANTYFETGADAMLRALDKVETYVQVAGKDELLVAPAITFNFKKDGKWVKGKWVFIPDEKEGGVKPRSP
jgi:hypothetical protein